MIELGTYEHYKGGRYEVIAVGLLEATGEPAVVYKALYENPKSEVWIRTETDFIAEVEVDGKIIPRFRKVN
ncbi:MAG TPA: DUF1653 domain-containing protein [Candidatus Doudnabacteria bacterium]|nr:DUF1653 domain-containing protein [Candidatus Doudnabacteria bacterium]